MIEEENETMKLICHENKDMTEFIISKSAAINSGFITNYINTCWIKKKSHAVELNVDSKTLKAIGTYLEHFKDEDCNSKTVHVMDDKDKRGIESQFTSWEVKFIRDYELDFVVDLINAAEDHAIPSLHNLACARIAEFMMLNSDEDIEKEFKITCNINEKDYEDVMKSHNQNLNQKV